MAIRKSQKVEPPRVIGAISEFAGTLVGTAVVVGKHIIKTASQANEEPLSKPEEKTVRTPAGKKTAAKTKVKSQKVKKKVVKKKVAKKKSIAPATKSTKPRKGSAQSPAKKKKRKAKIS